MVKCGVLFEVRSEFLYIIWTSFGFKGLTCMTTELQYMQFREEIFLFISWRLREEHL
jgi:hypothetical protein